MNSGQPRYRAVIFDLDGTLTDTASSIVEAAGIALAAVGAGTPPPDQVRPLIGLPLEQVHRRLRFLASTPATLLPPGRRHR